MMRHLLKNTKQQILMVLAVLFIVSIFGCGVKAEAKVPVYGENQKAEIKKYLSSLPDTMSAKEAKKRGIIINWSVKSEKEKYFQKEWLSFYKYARAGEKQYILQQKGVFEGMLKPYECAITILNYTIEGDACYTYLSFINGIYYMLEDSSRDKFKDPSWDGYSDLMTYKSLRKYKKTQYYLFKKQSITSKKIKKIVNSSQSKNIWTTII